MRFPSGRMGEPNVAEKGGCRVSHEAKVIVLEGLQVRRQQQHGSSRRTGGRRRKGVGLVGDREEAPGWHAWERSLS